MKDWQFFLLLGAISSTPHCSEDVAIIVTFLNIFLACVVYFQEIKK